MSVLLTSAPITIPVIDFGPFISGTTAQQQQVAQEIYQACHHVGFMYLKQHGVPRDLLDRVFGQSQRFFARPLAEKEQLAWSSEFSNRGYVGMLRERLDPNQPGDLKECFNAGVEGATASSPDTTNPALTQNKWLPHDDAFRQTVLEFFDACTVTANHVFRAFSLALQLPDSFISDRHQKREHVLRLLHYPPMSQIPEPGQIRAGAHSDYGSITLLFQDDVGGLEVQTTDGQWLLAPCIPDTVLVNTGDLIQRWSNDVFRSTKHRVGIPTGDRAHKSRYSIAFFCQPDCDAEIACIDSCQSPDNPPKYPPILSGDYLVSLLQATY